MSYSQFILGTANLGQKYGINNQSEYRFKDSELVFKHALSKGIERFDTSPDYGLAYKIISNNMSGKSAIRITSKISSKIEISPKKVVDSLEKSLLDLKISNLDTVLFHNPDSYLAFKFEDAVKAILETGKVKNVGVSVYNKTQILRSLEKSELLNTFQVPENILDRRLISDPEMLILKNQGINFEVRSIFLQGLLLTPTSIIKGKLNKIEKQLEVLNQFANDLSISLVAVCLNFAQKIEWSNGTIISAADISQLDHILNQRFIEFDFEKLPVLPEEYLDPRLWNFKL